MKQRILLAFLLTFTLLYGYRVTNVLAGNGPSDEWSYVSFFELDAQDNSGTKVIYEPNTVHNDALEGATYDKTTNTLTLNNLKTNLGLSVNEMGEDFKIKLVGENEISYMIVYGFEYGGNVEFVGDGSIVINEDKKEECGVTMAAEGTVGRFTVDCTATVKVYGSEQAIKVFYSTEKDGSKVIVLKNGQDISENVVSGKQVEQEQQQMRAFTTQISGNSEYGVAIKDSKKYTVWGEGPYTVSRQTIVSSGDNYFYDPYSNSTGESDKYFDNLEDLEAAGYTLTNEHVVINSYLTNFGNYPLAVSANGTRYVYMRMFNIDTNTDSYVVYNIMEDKVTLADGYEYTLMTRNDDIEFASLTELFEERINDGFYSHEVTLKELEVYPQVANVKEVVKASDNKSDNDKVAADAMNELLALIEEGKTISGMSDKLIVIITEAVENGDIVTVELETNNISSDEVSKEVTDKVNEAIKKDNTLKDANILGYFDINLLVKVNNDTLDEKVTELNKEIEVKLDISSLIEKLDKVQEGKTRVFKVVRIHGDKTDFLDATLNNDNTLSFKTDSFSSYTVTYKDIENPSTLDDIIKYAGILGIFGIALVVIIIFIIKNKKQ